MMNKSTVSHNRPYFIERKLHFHLSSRCYTAVILHVILLMIQPCHI